jgi:hypothetical protein
MLLIKVDAKTGKTIISNKISTAKNDLNIHKFESCNLVLMDNLIGMIVSRTMTKYTDGLNHQGAIAVVLSTDKLQVIKNLGQTSGHSFGNSLIKRSDKKFSGIDLGDNYPRGINYWNFTA